MRSSLFRSLTSAVLILTSTVSWSVPAWALRTEAEAEQQNAGLEELRGKLRQFAQAAGITPAPPSVRAEPPIESGAGLVEARKPPAAGVEEWAGAPSIMLHPAPHADDSVVLEGFNAFGDQAWVSLPDRRPNGPVRLAFRAVNSGKVVSENVLALRMKPLRETLDKILPPASVREIWDAGYGKGTGHPDFRNPKTLELLRSQPVLAALAESKRELIQKMRDAGTLGQSADGPEAGLLRMGFQPQESVILFNTAGNDPKAWTPFAHMTVVKRRNYNNVLIFFSALRQVGINRKSNYEKQQVAAQPAAGLEEQDRISAMKSHVNAYWHLLESSGVQAILGSKAIEVPALRPIDGLSRAHSLDEIRSHLNWAYGFLARMDIPSDPKEALMDHLWRALVAATIGEPKEFRDSLADVGLDRLTLQAAEKSGADPAELAILQADLLSAQGRLNSFLAGHKLPPAPPAAAGLEESGLRQIFVFGSDPDQVDRLHQAIRGFRPQIKVSSGTTPPRIAQVFGKFDSIPDAVILVGKDAVEFKKHLKKDGRLVQQVLGVSNAEDDAVRDLLTGIFDGLDRTIETTIEQSVPLTQETIGSLQEETVILPSPSRIAIRWKVKEVHSSSGKVQGITYSDQPIPDLVPWVYHRRFSHIRAENLFEQYPNARFIPSRTQAGAEERAGPLKVLVVGEGVMAERIGWAARLAAGSVSGSTRSPSPGVEVLVVSTDEEARKAMSRNKPDLIFAMGEFDGGFASNVLKEARKLSFPEPEVFLVDSRLLDEREQQDRLRIFDNRFIPIDLLSDPELKKTSQAVKLRVAAHLSARLAAGLEEVLSLDEIGRLAEEIAHIVTMFAPPHLMEVTHYESRPIAQLMQLAKIPPEKEEQVVRLLKDNGIELENNDTLAFIKKDSAIAANAPTTGLEEQAQRDARASLLDSAEKTLQMAREKIEALKGISADQEVTKWLFRQELNNAADRLESLIKRWSLINVYQTIPADLAGQIPQLWFDIGRLTQEIAGLLRKEPRNVRFLRTMEDLINLRQGGILVPEGDLVVSEERELARLRNGGVLAPAKDRFGSTEHKIRSVSATHVETTAAGIRHPIIFDKTLLPGTYWYVDPLAAGLEEKRAILSFNPAASVAMSRAGIRPVVVAATPTDARQQLGLGVDPGQVIGLLWAGLEEKDYLAVNSGIRTFVSADVSASGWQGEVTRVVAQQLGRQPIVITDAASLASGLEELGIPGSRIEEILDAQSAVQAGLEQMV